MRPRPPTPPRPPCYPGHCDVSFDRGRKLLRRLDGLSIISAGQAVQRGFLPLAQPFLHLLDDGGFAGGQVDILRGVRTQVEQLRSRSLGAVDDELVWVVQNDASSRLRSEWALLRCATGSDSSRRNCRTAAIHRNPSLPDWSAMRPSRDRHATCRNGLWRSRLRAADARW